MNTKFANVIFADPHDSDVIEIFDKYYQTNFISIGSISRKIKFCLLSLVAKTKKEWHACCYIDYGSATPRLITQFFNHDPFVFEAPSNSSWPRYVFNPNREGRIAQVTVDHKFIKMSNINNTIRSMFTKEGTMVQEPFRYLKGTLSINNYEYTYVKRIGGYQSDRGNRKNEKILFDIKVYPTSTGFFKRVINRFTNPLQLPILERYET